MHLSFELIESSNFFQTEFLQKEIPGHEGIILSTKSRKFRAKFRTLNLYPTAYIAKILYKKNKNKRKMDSFSAYILKKPCIFLVQRSSPVPPCTSNQPRRIPLRNYALDGFIDTKKYLDRKDTETRNRLFSAGLKNLDLSFENYSWASNPHLRACS